MARDLNNIRNIGIIAHIDAGKTTLTERMLFYAGATHKMGDVDKGTTTTDSDEEEQQRGITIYSAAVTFRWKHCAVNLLDTPGHVDFTAEVERCLRVLDGAVVVFSAREGVEAQSETVWRQAEKYQVPKLVFINKLDREGADFEAVLEEIRRRLPSHPVPLQIPVGLGPAHVRDPFRGVIDLLEMKLLSFDPESEGREITIGDVPEDLLPTAEIWREQMLEELYNLSNELMELALSEEEIPVELLRKVIREGTVAGAIQPVLCGSALQRIGVQPVLDAAAYYLPSPVDRPPVEGVDVKTQDKKLVRKPDPDEPFAALVFKILPAKHGDFVWIRVYSGRLRANSRVLNPGRDKKENVAQLWLIHASKREEQIDSVETGDIVGLIGPRHSITGDTLCETKAPILLETIAFPETVISMAIEPETIADRKKLSETLEMMKRQDPTFHALESEDTGQTIISGMGELHLEVIQHRLERDFNLKVKVHKPRVSYRETVAEKVEIVGECNRTLGGQALFGRVKIRVERNEKNTAVTVMNLCTNEAIPRPLIDAALDELKGRGEGGGIIGGFPLSQLRITLLDAEVAETGSDEVAFRIAASDAFDKALTKAGPVLLEPVMRLSITTPDEHMGDVVGDIQQRRGLIAKTEQRGDMTMIEAHAPLAELFGYSSAIRSVSQGRAGHSMEPLEYAPAPPAIAQSFAM